MEGAEQLLICFIFAGHGFGGYLQTLRLQNQQPDTISCWNVTGAFVSPNGTMLVFWLTAMMQEKFSNIFVLQ